MKSIYCHTSRDLKLTMIGNVSGLFYLLLLLITSANSVPGYAMEDCLPFSYIDKEAAGFDIIIEKGRIVDGTGNSCFYADVGIIEGSIIKIGNLEGSSAGRRIDASGMLVAPGFIDIHTHSENNILKIPSADNTVRQGITTIVAGNCGGSPIPVRGFLEKVTDAGISVNYVTLVGHNSVRRSVMGGENRAPSREELSKMKSIVEESMKAGAFGLSTGLYYTPGNYAETDEIIELAKVVSKFNGIYVTHLRDESDYNIGLLAAVQEALTIGSEANVRVQISHMKCLGRPVWHKSDEVLDLIRNARQSGVDVLFDQYPYTASSTGLWGAVFPAWAQEGGIGRFLQRLEEPAAAEKISNEIADNIERRGGAGSLYIIREGAYLSDLAGTWNLSATEAAIEIQKSGGSGVISFNMTDYDLENFIRSPYGMIGSDGSISSMENTGHPRSFGAFPRVLSLYVREKGILSWEEAVRRMTSSPAMQLGLWDRGVLRPGMKADIVVIDPESVNDTATYQNPAALPDGIPYVLVNGIPVVDRDIHTGAPAGKVILSR